MKYIITEEKLKKFIHKYMDLTYPELIQEKDDRDNILFKDKKGETVFLVDERHIFFDGKLMFDLSEMFNVEVHRDVLDGLGSWVEKKYGIKDKVLF